MRDLLVLYLLFVSVLLGSTNATAKLRKKRKDPTILGHGPLVGIVNRVKVARRNLHNFPTSASDLAHSALLLETTDGQKYICEYMGDSRVYLTHIKPTIIHIHTPDWGTDRFEARGALGHHHYTNFEWTVQHTGTRVDPTKMITPRKVKHVMSVVTGLRDYDLISHNCHDAQEATRKAFGWM